MGLNDHADDYKEAKRHELTGRLCEWQLEQGFNKAGSTLLSIKFRNDGGSFLIIAERAMGDGLKEVAFARGSDIGSGLRRFYALLVQDRLKWRPSRPWGGSSRSDD